MEQIKRNIIGIKRINIGPKSGQSLVFIVGIKNIVKIIQDFLEGGIEKQDNIFE
jgi:hypothetical protein